MNLRFTMVAKDLGVLFYEKLTFAGHIMDINLKDRIEKVQV